VGGFDTTNKNRVGHVYVTRSNDDGVTFGTFVEATTPRENPDGVSANTKFRDGIIEHFAASPTHVGHHLSPTTKTRSSESSPGPHSTPSTKPSRRGAQAPPLGMSDIGGPQKISELYPTMIATHGSGV
jgi:hypothetical protein